MNYHAVLMIILTAVVSWIYPNKLDGKLGYNTCSNLLWLEKTNCLTISGRFCLTR